jgi:hypothetical protein
LPSSEISVTGESSTKSSCDSGTSEGVETTSLGAAELTMVMAKNTEIEEKIVFMKLQWLATPPAFLKQP